MGGGGKVEVQSKTPHIFFSGTALQCMVTWWTLLYFPEKTPTVYGDLMNFVIFSREDSYSLRWLDDLYYIFQRKLLQCMVTWWTLLYFPEKTPTVYGDLMNFCYIFQRRLLQFTVTWWTLLYFPEKTPTVYGCLMNSIIFSRDSPYSLRWLDELCYIFQRRLLQFTVTWWTLLYFPKNTPTLYSDLMNFVIFSREDSYSVWRLDELCYIFQRRPLQCTVTWWTLLYFPEKTPTVYGDLMNFVIFSREDSYSVRWLDELYYIFQRSFLQCMVTWWTLLYFPEKTPTVYSDLMNFCYIFQRRLLQCTVTWWTLLYFLEKSPSVYGDLMNFDIFSREDSYSVRWLDELCYIFQRRPFQCTVTWWTLLYFPEKTPTGYGDLMNFVIFSREDPYSLRWLDELCYIFQRKSLLFTVTWWTLLYFPENTLTVYGDLMNFVIFSRENP